MNAGIFCLQTRPFLTKTPLIAVICTNFRIIGENITQPLNICQKSQTPNLISY